uniref:Uncharacterized protein n=1 Tax=Ditylenchus dipsaci TaxID=166011 RepID=A0A915DLL4_9BILA
MDKLLSIQKQIQACVPANSADYMNLLRQWLTNRITLEAFDHRAQKLIPIELHTKFLLSVVAAFDVTATFCSTEAELNSQNVNTRAATGYLPTKNMIYSLGFIISLDYGFTEEMDKDVAPFIQTHVKTMVANMLESVLKMSRSFVCSESGFVHSFGIQKTNPRTAADLLGQNTSSSALAICLPAKEPINAEDLLDCLDLDLTLVPHTALRERLVKRLENIDSSSRMCLAGTKRTVKKEEMP